MKMMNAFVIYTGMKIGSEKRHGMQRRSYFALKTFQPCYDASVFSGEAYNTWRVSTDSL
jgi:hypothetical protein